tara:strand:+ start:2310 stop:2657 length:348 start_codon:yes stop_codon:yes gene_type:complete
MEDELLKTTYNQINLCTDLDKFIEKECMLIKTEYYKSFDGEYGIFENISSVFVDDSCHPIDIDYVEGGIRINIDNCEHIDLDENHILFLLKFLRYAKKIDDKCFNMTSKQIEKFK